ncbi:hypothetical protein J437_LFUL005395 [Ladona fulva]|uniref:Uncharacterized protein n=1 Tax=Ladona fulva TaxID=123851 RepID=A0A8K0K3K7_LADFU|nr:hypothetical protein J437_LFUL005395 [Ladona fulva]
MSSESDNFNMVPQLKGIVLFVILVVSPLQATYPPLDCPEVCSCHYFRTNWVTECSSKGLTAVPQGLSQSVYILDLSRNKINGQNNSLRFSEGVKVRRLHLADNKIAEVAKETFVGLSYLLEVDLSGNSISKFDREAFLESPGLISLELRRNPFTGPEGGKSFVVSRSLKTLDLSDCRIRQLTAGFFDDATSVSEVDLSGNPLESIDPEALVPLAGLEKLKMNRCRLSSVTPNLLHGSQHLKHVEAAWNPKLFAGSHEPTLPELLKGLIRLDHLDLRGTGLTNVPSESFKDTIELANLMLSDNDLSASSETIVPALSILQNMHELDLEGCRFKFPSLSFLANMTKIRILRLGRNDISETLTTPSVEFGLMDFDRSFSHLKKMKRLSLDHCEINRLPNAKGLSQLSEVLVELDVSDNPIVATCKGENCSPEGEVDKVSLEALSESIRTLKVLEILDMSRCNITQLAPDTFKKSFQLRRLVLSGNPLTRKKDGERVPGIESGLFSPAHRLEILELADCGFTEPPSPDAMPESERDEEYSLETDRKKKKERMEDDEDTILDTQDDEAGPSLRELVLAGNPMLIDGPLPPYVSSLEKLDLSRCGLKKIPSNAFVWAVNLTQLSLSGNLLGSITKSIEVFPTPIATHGKSEDGTNDKKPEAVKGTSNTSIVQVIHVADKAHNPDLSFLSWLHKLRSLDLRRCGLTSLTYSSIANLSLESLRLAGNPWACSCNLVALWEWASKSGKDILLHRPPPVIGAPVVADPSIEEEHGLRCTARDGTRMPWSRFILSTHQLHDCGPPPAKLVALASLMHQEPEKVDMVSAVSREIGSPSSWSVVIGCSVGLLFLIVLIAAGLVIHNKRRNFKLVSPAPQGNALLLDEESMGHAATVRWASRPYRETTHS